MPAAPPLPLPVSALQSLAHRSGWLPKQGSLDLIDGAWVEALPQPLWIGLLRGSEPDPVDCLLALTTQGSDWQEASASPIYQRDFLRLLATVGRVPLAQGAIEFNASAPDTDWAQLQLSDGDLGGSSNCVSQLALDRTRVMHKVYRRLDAGRHEAAACRLLQEPSAPLLARHLGDYHYVDAQGHSRPLGLLYECVEGHGLHADLSRHLRAMWAQPQPHFDPEAADWQALHTALLQWPEFLNRFHARLNRAVGLDDEARQAPLFDMARYAHKLQQRLNQVRPQLLHDPLLSPPQARRLAALLEAAAAQVLRPEATDGLRSSACHGDLHLSHLLWQYPRPELQQRLIDVSPQALAPSDPEFRCGHALMDRVAVARALDYFYLDEATYALKQRSGCSSALAMQHLLLSQLEPEALSPATQAQVQALHGPGQAWLQAVRRALCSDASRHPAWAPFHFGRLLAELDYNYTHRRAQFRCIDFHALLASWGDLTR